VTNEELVEKLQHLRDILIAKSRWDETPEDHATYAALRTELMATPDVKQVLPPYVKSSRNLGDFWNYLKGEHGDLKSYKSRRDFIWNEFKPLVASLEDPESVDAQAFFPKGSDHDAYTHIREILQRAKVSLLIIDGYMDSSMYQVLATLTGSLNIRMLTAKPPADFALEGSKFAKQHGFTLEIRTTRDFHDRFILVDNKECYLLGASIKDAGARGFVIVPLKDFPVVKFFRDYAEKVWDAAQEQ
jgi:hypothetical protein